MNPYRIQKQPPVGCFFIAIPHILCLITKKERVCVTMLHSQRAPSHNAIHNSRHKSAEDVSRMAKILDGKTVRVVRGMMQWTPYRLAKAAVVKPNQLKRFENGSKKDLSPRDRAQLAATFHAAGLDIFTGQGEIMLRFPHGDTFSVNALKNVFSGAECQAQRESLRLSLKDLERLTRIWSFAISSFERGTPVPKPPLHLFEKWVLQRTLADLLEQSQP